MSNSILAILANSGSAGVDLPVSIAVNDVEIFPTDAIASFTMSSAGTYSSVGNTSTVPPGTWLLYGSAADYDVRFTTAGSPTGSLTNTWLNLGSGRTWTCTDTTQVGGPVTASGTLELSRAGAATVIKSCPLSLSASKEPA